MSENLPASVEREVDQLCSEALVLVESKRYDAALLRYKAALDLLPPPKTQWCGGLRILQAMVDTCFLKGDFSNAEQVLYAAIQFPDGDRLARVCPRLERMHFE